MPKMLLACGRHRLEYPYFDLEGMEKRSRATVYQEFVENYCGTMRSILHAASQLLILSKSTQQKTLLPMQNIITTNRIWQTSILFRLISRDHYE
ncbi:hypothetical protein CEXT_237311 [Caerostris extrusa]|uniref:Uncharacterized protein n=1 Tax=Caerostris extrusa TaxID=172846 RepID=A0AAV4MA76_CAEEX|nr:hypothetical protein CEXT_237311 [Caerostris extrusa]